MLFLRSMALPGCILMILVGLSAGGCSKSSPQNSPQQGQSQNAEANQDDRSLTPAEYVELGLPVVDRRWSAQDMVLKFPHDSSG